MSRKRSNLFLYLALVCFAGLLAVFIIDGYLGIHETIYITAEEYEQKIETDHWYHYSYDPSVRTAWTQKVFFAYEIENRQFSTYSTTIKASAWKENEKIADLLSESKSIRPFHKMRVEWILDSDYLESLGFEQGQYTVKIERGEVERKVIVYYSDPLYLKGAPVR